jgi:hypothetical protein
LDKVAVRNASAAAGVSRTRASARAVLTVDGLLPTSTMTRDPSSAMCEGFGTVV